MLKVKSPDNSEEELTLDEWLAKVPEMVLAKKDELGLLMLERSARKGYHLVFKRRENLTQEENLQWASDLLGVQYDEGAKDITRVFYTTTGSKDDLLFLSEELFDNKPATIQEQDIERTKVENDEPIVVDESASLEEDGTGIDYDTLIPEIFKKKCGTYPIVPQGTRNSTISSVCYWLRHVCEFSPEKMKAVLYPKFTYGLPEKEVDSIIRSSIGADHFKMPIQLQKLVDENITAQLEDGDGSSPSEAFGGGGGGAWADPYAIYPSLASCVVQDMALPSLPRWVNTLLKVTLPGYRFITLVGASTAMMTLLTDVQKKNGSKAPARLNGWSHWDGLSGSGKRQLKFVIDQLIKPIRLEDERKRERVNSVIEANKAAKDGEKRIVPPLAQRILECDTTRKGHIQQMEALKGKKTYTYAEELSSLNLNRSGYYFRGDFCRLNFDNGMVGCLNATGDSPSIVTACNWDVTTTSTHDQTLAQWAKDVQNGAAQRVFFCLVPDNTWQPKPKEVQWTDEEVAYLDRATSLMMKMQGLVLTPRLDKALDEWLENVRITLMSAPKANRQVERARFRFRTAEIAHTFAVVMHCCYIVQDILDREDELTASLNAKLSMLDSLKKDLSATTEQIAEAEREAIKAREVFDQWKVTALDLDQYGEHKQCIELAIFSADYCLDMQDTLWSKRMRAQLLSNSEGVSTTRVNSKSDDDYEKMPERFTMDELIRTMTWKSGSAVRKMVERFVKCNLVKKVGKEGRIAIYEKTVA